MRGPRVASYVYGGTAEQIYPQYIDEATGRTLVAEPGGTYTITQVPDEVAAPDGGTQPLRLPMPPDGRWTATKKTPPASASAAHQEAS